MWSLTLILKLVSLSDPLCSEKSFLLLQTEVLFRDSLSHISFGVIVYCLFPSTQMCSIYRHRPFPWYIILKWNEKLKTISTQIMKVWHHKTDTEAFFGWRILSHTFSAACAECFSSFFPPSSISDIPASEHQSFSHLHLSTCPLRSAPPWPPEFLKRCF